MNIWEFLTLVADGLTVFIFGMLFTLWLIRTYEKRTSEVRLPWEKEEKKRAKQEAREAEKARREWWYGPTVREKELMQERERQKALRKAEKRKKKSDRVFLIN